MKQLMILLSILFLSLNLQSQSKGTSQDELKDPNYLRYTINKSIFTKPENHCIVLPYIKSNYFHTFNLSEYKKSAFLDSLKLKTELKIIPSENDKVLWLNIIFPKMDQNTYLSVEKAKTKILETHIYGSDNKELNLLKNQILHIKNDVHKDAKSKTKSYNMNIYREIAHIDSTLNIENCHGSVRYKISFIIGYDSLRLDKSSISKTFRFGNTKVKVIDIIENNVILEEINSNKELKGQYPMLLNFDSQGNVLCDYSEAPIDSVLEHPTKFRKSRKLPFSVSSIISKSNYNILKTTPEISYEDYLKAVRLKQEDKSNINYIVCSSYGPLKYKFLLYKPIYGNEQIFEVNLSK